MRKIPCSCCENRYGDYAIWIVFDSLVICDTCRVIALEFMRLQGFGFDPSHPFTRELLMITRR